MTEGNMVFTEAQESLLKDVIDRIVPAEGEFPGAGDLGVTAYIDKAVGRSAALKRLFPAGLAHIEITASKALGREFSDLSGEERDVVLRQVEQEQSVFFDALVQQTYNGYYTNPAIFPLIGYQHPPPRDYPVKPFDPSLLDKVRQRGPVYRQV